MSRKLKLLIVEDEEPILRGLIDVFLYHGYEVESATDGKQGLDMALSGNYDLVLLDVMLPSMDGFTVCNNIRQSDRNQPIIMLTAKTTDEDIITGLSLGADDYVGKPFSVRQLVLRVEAVLRRSQKLIEENRSLAVGKSLTIDTFNLVGVHKNTDESDSSTHEQIPFTRREVNILQYLKSHSDRPVSREELLEQVWGYSKASRIETRTVDIHIAKLRRKIEPDAKNPTYLVTVRGEGYRLLETNSE